MKSAVNYKLINIALFLIVIFFLYQTKSLWLNIISVIIKVIRPFLISFVISYLLHPIIKILSKKINKKLAGFLVILVTLLIFGILLKKTIPLVYKELSLLIKELDLFIDSIGAKYNGILTNNMDILINKLNEYLSHDLIGLLTKSISIIIEIITILVLSIYFTFNYDLLRNKISKYTNRKNYKIYQLLRSIDQELSSYIMGIGIIMLVEVIEYTIIYYVIGHPNFLLLSMLSSFTTVIPFFGGLFTNVIALITASVNSRSLFILTAVVIIIMPIIDSYLIQPRIYKKTNSLPPLLTIVIVIIGGMIFNIIGVMIAIPLYIIVKNLIKLTIINK